MKSLEFVGKSLEEIKEKIKEQENLDETDYFLVEEEAKKGGLFSGKKIAVNIYTKEEVVTYIREKLNEIAKEMNIELKLETKIRDSHISVKMFSNNNSILIGKGGQTLIALQNILKQSLSIKYNINVNIILDVEQYKEKQNKSIEFLAKKIAREVSKTKIEVKMDSMNSYQRRLIHNALKDFKGAYSISEGTEPNRYVIIKPKED